jgi:Pvc16 N-terminal domain
MTLLRLSLVTQGLLALLDEAITSSPEWVAGTTLSTSPDPPDRLSGDHTIALYLYHAVEDPHRRNPPSPGGTPMPERHIPMPLVLHYLLTAHSDLPAGSRTYEEQFLMGLAMKALRDFPVLDDDTIVDGTQVMPSLLRGRDNRFRITAQAVPATDAVAYWTAGQNALRMSAYYEVAGTLLEPELVLRRAGRVFAYGVHTIVAGAPRLTGSRSTTSFLFPGDPVVRQVETRPAQAAIGDAFDLLGTALTGDATDLVLEHPAWPEPVTVDAVLWGVIAQPEGIRATVQREAGGRSVLPGIYAASVAVATDLQQPGGGTRRVVARSNVTPFAVAPAVVAIGAPTAEQRITVTGGRFDPAVLTADEDIEVWVGTDRLARVTTTPTSPTQPGEYEVLDDDNLELRLPAGLTTGDELPLRIVVRGIESPPRWVTVP